jgi:hypothetical protein
LSAGGPARGEQRREAVDRAEPHEPIDEPTGRVGRPELLAEDPGHEVELGDRDQPPVEPADDDEDGGE